MISATLIKLKENIEKALNSLQGDLYKIQTNRANPSMLDNIKINYHGTIVPINQLSIITSPGSRIITIKPFDKSIIAQIGKAIANSDLGFAINNNGATINITVPSPTVERRNSLIKVVHKLGEKYKIAIRKFRNDTKADINHLQKSGYIGEDETNRTLKIMESIIKTSITDIDTIIFNKENSMKSKKVGWLNTK